MKPYESQWLNKLAIEEVLVKQKTLARLYQINNTSSVHEPIESDLKKNDEFTHVKRAPLSIMNEKTAVELTSLFL